MYYSLLIACIAFLVILAQQCISADNLAGSCVNLATCPQIVQMAQNIQFSMVDAFYSYLSQSLCGFDGNDLLVRYFESF